MPDERVSRPGHGPYRTDPRSSPPRRPWIPWAIFAALIAALVALYFVLPDEHDASSAAIPAAWLRNADAWPAPEADLPPATPLAPLLVADSPEALAITAPPEGASRLRRGESLYVRFNRPMVAGASVGRPVASPPIAFDPAIAGEAVWTSRSTLSFVPAPTAFTSGVREVRLLVSPELTSLSGEALLDDAERVLVLDGAPRVLTHRSHGRVTAGAPLPLVFDAEVDLRALSSELLLYEMGGGQRSVPVTLAASRTPTEEGQHRVDVRLSRALEPGSQIALALAPRYLPWESTSPVVLQYELAPRPFVEGIACPDGAVSAEQCSFTGPPGGIVDIGPTLRLLASARLAEATLANVRVTPSVPALAVRLAPHGPPQHRLIEITAEWEPDQVYELRVANLRTESGEPLRAMPPLAIRSAGHPPSIEVATGRLTFEHDAERALAFRVIQPAAGDVLHRGVSPGDELRALVSPSTFVRDGADASPLAPLAPTARANRWGPGRFSVPDRMAVVAFRPDPSRAPGDVRTAFVQATDLGVTVRAHAQGLLVWVTRLSSAEPVRGAAVTVADAQGAEQADATTDTNGVATIRLSASPLAVTHAIRVVHGDDRAALLLDPRTAVTPSGLGLTPGEQPVSDGTVAIVIPDRGAYRPGEGLHAKIVLRRVDGERASAVREGRFVVRLVDPARASPLAEREVRPNRFGTASVDFDLPAAISLGTLQITVARHDATYALGAASVQVAEFRQPTFRVDLGAVSGPVHVGDHVGVDASATYLFGAPVTSGTLRWSLVRDGGASYPERWSQYVFGPVGERATRATVAEGEGELGASGVLHLDAAVAPSPTRARYTLEAEVTDGAGHTHAGRRSFTAYPASLEVGVRNGPDWVEAGRELALEAVAIDHAGEPTLDVALEARFVREGWHSWWEWSEASHAHREGSYQLRRDNRREVVHTCALRSAAEPVACRFTPSRAGTYVLELEARDDAGRVTRASRRVYVAGPDEQPDRDPPGAPIGVTPVRRAWTVGETAELAFESPFEEAEALITVEREGVLHVEHRRVGPGGQVIRVPVTAAMVPNVYVGVTLVKPRTGAPGERVDLNAPDLRFGVAGLDVRPATAALRVTLDVPTSARPGTEVPVAVRVTDEHDRPVQGEVALWAVDEGTLRLTGYEVPDPTQSLYRPRPAAFAWDDVRRALVSRVRVPEVPEPSGDGGESSGRRLDVRERFDPTPLWQPSVVTDAQGRATVTLTLPARPTEYRVMAVALDTGARSGRASTRVVAEQPLVLRSALPRFLTAGDRVQAGVFVHNATEAPLEVRVVATIAGERRAARTLTIAGGGEARIDEAITAPNEGPVAVSFEARAGSERTALSSEIPIVPRARFVRSQVSGGAIGEHELTLGLPESTPRHGAGARITVASHPFVGLDGAMEALETSTWPDTETLSARVLGLCAYAALEVPDRALDADELRARARRAVASLVAQQAVDGGFGRWSSLSYPLPAETALATHALACAAERGWLDDRAALDRARELLVQLANGSAFADHYGEPGFDANAYALRVLTELEAPQAARVDALYAQRERLSPYGLAQLALAMGDEDARFDTLVVETLDQVLATREDEARDPSRLRSLPYDARTLGALLEAASRAEVGRARAGDVAGALLARRAQAQAFPWGHPLDTARALSGLAAYARLWRFDEGAEPRAWLDGTALAPTASTGSGASFGLLADALRGTHRLRLTGASGAPIFYAIDGRYGVPLGEPDTIARGRRAAIHRVYETPDGRRLMPGEPVPLGALVRVRLFVHTEAPPTGLVALTDPIPAGFEAVDAGLDTTPQASLAALMGTSPDDEISDARAHHAQRSLPYLAHRSFATDAAHFYFDTLPGGLSEYTYAIRASVVGETTAPPAQLEALQELTFVARSAMDTLVVAERD
jgi:uncharacterized protein YfaS (alpha-2-macroglobulin family)